MKVRFGVEMAMCYCHPFFGSSAMVLGIATLLPWGLRTNGEVVLWRQNSTYRCGLPVINETIAKVVME